MNSNEGTNSRGSDPSNDVLTGSFRS
jgi:hypothetical protein